MAAEERKLIPVASLKLDLPVYNVEEPAAAKAKRIAPLQNSPLTLFEDVFDQADHIRRGEPRGKHLFDCFSSDNREFSDLMIDSLFRVEASKSIDICTVECLNPGLNKSAWLHGFFMVRLRWSAAL